ncbi:hypothetical protein [Methylobacterium brachiatum]|uniref:hypothetical protein n=1 Tax=Methylobacterium brachiatum TaxID=269660 RepID=UPI0008F1B2D1|nr:hypothetical protein [Methylobacterium brachiatum]SFI51955.1 hypothetical protein SAMN02799642_02080 [Methylobacterium brachiatum]
MVRSKHYPSDATIADVLPNLEDAEGYLRQVLVTMRMCQKHYGDAWVRIGVTGKATAPSYRIDRPDASATPAEDGATEAGVAIFGAYGGRSHDRFTKVNTAETRWSSRSLGMAEMLALHDSLRRPKDGSA